MDTFAGEPVPLLWLLKLLMFWCFVLPWLGLAVIGLSKLIRLLMAIPIAYVLYLWYGPVPRA